MFMNFRRIHKCQCMQLLTTGLVLCVVMVCWEELDHHVVSHMKSYTYRYLVNSYDFLNSSFAMTTNHHHRKDGSNGADGGLVNYSYLINHPGKCGGGGGDGKSRDDVLLLLFVKSSAENFERRQAIRDTWGNESFLWSELGASVRMVFALGVHPDVGWRSRVQSELLQEDEAYGDLIQQNFLDTFHNLTTKLILQFHWGHEYCPQARFLMSADDDIFIHMPNLVKYLRQLLSKQSGAKDLWVGHVHRGAPPIRRKESKYHVSYDLYSWPSYPDYTAGAGYVVSGDVAAKIYHATLVLNSSMYIDDVFMGICAKAMGVSPQEHVYFSGEGKTPYHPCIYDHMITSHGHATDVRSLWQAATNPTVYSNSRGFMGNLYCTAVRVMLLCLPYYQNTYSCMAAFT
ncbi:lactosylceramide 1,3-N-acetyl-beta-D-glucosaminyltransferase A [Siniperca chuatsi]|uniref:lactosylceramide 1,3-N-acetyl-beta-D-glucosaminyltransferase A n=1 Tax=Siniperca chuatsi TaxID=119488 RepID=UPI001CE1DCFD|nr:lactosylceramide 1,3-N-acetyl-beta-D-glucosaminyltransferase A [Siniperca chuatsi]XP_044055578.1 lactosylceramide 1,3-N-acetyl-beta-D-glucosaminyltransferase A [Siniperca chuatsi]XP_044055579.1 lactosylceramide 1,3-N-acetyl-beta-D-glucosaminyltransferase A [Siniperca chuatsi]XP_044055580.1 lactosylceramide 1,3-N-acetyl-beta-D-glucosaminyltransferase A [Siniperca chuatsi]XP_044055581.1 lactosylceramide 1,3-N-acetyl-beta-D-glucosaminyltransferase A [Siniperca chuatsi]XP_044055582.1 lactosylce